MFANDHDTISRPHPRRPAAIAVVRISGPGCSETLKTMAPGAEFPDRRAVLRTLRHPQSREPLDRALITRFQAPRSFTGEEMAEISVTGGRAISRGPCRSARAHSGAPPRGARGSRLARFHEREDRSFRSGRARRSGRSGNGGAKATGPKQRRRGAEPRVRSDSDKPARGHGGDRDAD